jgi:glutathione S-transferase
MSDSTPLLWHIAVSHYSEKARWALDYKQVPHRRRAVSLPGMHIPASLWMTRGASKTFPVLEIDGHRIGDSTEIIAVLEGTHPERPLYPADPTQRRRALELEDFFDEELGPHARLLPFHELSNEPAMFAEVAAAAVPGPLGRAKGPLGLYARAYTGLRFGVRDDAAAVVARQKIVAALDRLEAELEANGGGEFLIGDSFSVADLTAASLFYPVVGPEEGPLPADSPTPPRLEAFRAEIDQRPGYLWVEETFRRHRHPAPAPAVAASN